MTNSISINRVYDTINKAFKRVHFIHTKHLKNTPNLYKIYRFNSQLSKKAEPKYEQSGLSNIFTVKTKKRNIGDNKKTKEISKYKNYSGEIRHYPAATKEWFNSIYAYNADTIKKLPSTDKITSKLVKSYFNMYNSRLDIKKISKRLRVRSATRSSNRILVGRPELKHTADKAIITVYTHNKEKSYYENRLYRIASIDEIDKFIPRRTRRVMKYNEKPFPSDFIGRQIKSKGKSVVSNIKRISNRVITNIEKKSPSMSSGLLNSYKYYEKKYLKLYAARSMHREMFSAFYKRLLSFNISKYEKTYLLPFIGLIQGVYKKKVELNIVDLKNLYLDSHIFSETLIRKIKIRKNALHSVLKASIDAFEVPEVDREAMYDDMYNKK